ncbi:MAG: GntR family transcriptional regulator [Firmicutes bacterium]|nr:GntR family transcriptional regulator [Bacillota bacterium]
MSTDEHWLTEHECYQKLRRAIVEGALMPNERLIEMELVRRFRASRSTIRTVLARLEQEGLVERERYRGARVRMVTLEEASEILEVRMALECLIVRHAAERGTDEEVFRLQTILGVMRDKRQRGDLIGYSEGNASLHRAIAEMSRHQTATRLLDMLNSQSVRFQYRTILAPARPDQSLAEHATIVSAIAARDPDSAEAAMKIHLSRVHDVLRSTHVRL